MANNPKFLKNLLTTASALTLVAVTGTSALGAALRTTTGGNANALWDATIGTNLDNAVNGGNRDSVRVANVTNGGQTAAVGGINMGAITLSAQMTAPFLVTGVSTIGSFITDGGSYADVTVSAGILTLDGLAGLTTGGVAGTANKYDGLRNVILNGVGAGLSIIPAAPGNITITGTIDGDVAGRGAIVVDNVGAVTTTFQGVIGGTAVTSLTLINASKVRLEANASFDSTNAVAGIVMGNGSELIVQDGVNLTAANANSTRTIAGAGAANGTLTFEGASVVNGFTGGASGIGAGANNALAEIKIGAGKVSTDATIVKATNISFTNNNVAAELEFTGAAAHTITGNIRNTSGTDNVGTVTVNGANVTHNGNVGAVGANNSIKAIKFATDHEYKVIADDGTIFASEISSGVDAANRGKLGIQANAANLKNIGTANRKLTELNLYSNKVGNAAGTFTLLANETIYATSVNLAAAAHNNILVLEAGSRVNGNIVATGNQNNGTIQVNGDSRITGTVGAPLVKIGGINFNGAHTLTVDGNAISSNGAIAFGANDGVLKLTTANSTAITAPVTVTGPVGTIDSGVTAANTLTINGGIGAFAVANALKLVKTAGGKLALNGADVHITEIDLGNADTAELKLIGAGDYKLEKFTHGNGAGVVVVNGADVVLKEGTVLSKNDNKLKNVKFENANSMTLENGVNLYTVDGITNNVAGQGSIITIGDVILGGKIGANAAFGAITATGGALGNVKTLTILDDVNSGDITVHDYNLVKFNAASIKANSITAKVGGAKGDVEFANAGLTTVELAADSAVSLNNVKISGSGVTLSGIGVIKSNNFTFGNQGSALTFNPSVVGPINFAGVKFVTATAAANANQDLVFNQDVSFVANSEVGTAANAFRSVILKADKKATVSTDKFFTSIKTDQNETGEVEFNVALPLEGFVQNLGEKDKVLRLVKFTESGKVAGNSYSKSVEIAAGKTGKFARIVAGGEVLLQGAGATASFLDGSTLSSALKTTINNNGIAQFDGSSTIRGGIGESAARFAEVKFTDTTGNKVQSIEGTIYAQAVNFLNTQVKSTGDVKYVGAVNAAGTSFNLGSNVNTFSGGASTFTGAVKIVTEFDGTKIGTLKADGAGTTINLANGTLVVTLNDNTQTRVKGTQTFKLREDSTNGAAAFALANTTLAIGKDTNKLTDWTFDNTALTFTAVDQAEKILNDSFAKNGATSEAKENLAIFLNAEGAAKEYFDEVTALFNSSDAGEKSAAESVDRLSNPIATGTEAVASVISEAASVVTERIQGLASGNTNLQTVSLEGVSAGDQDKARYGAWGSVVYNQGIKKLDKGVSGYKLKSAGGTVGFDTMANDTMIVGVAATMARTDLKHKNVNIGDKTKADTMMFSIYGLQELADNWFVQGVASFGSTSIKNSAGRIGFLNGSMTKETASAKYDSMSYGGELLAGYNYKISEGAVVTPMFGLDYNRFNDSGYTETGTRNQNQIVSKKSTDKAQVIAGVRSVMAMDSSGVIINPEVHAFIRQSLGSKNPKMDIRLDGAGKLTTKSVKASKTLYNVGFGVGLQSGMVDYGIGYDLHLANKYVGHQGTLKVRVNF
jgi:outer membrane autotransporter protein